MLEYIDMNIPSSILCRQYVIIYSKARETGMASSFRLAAKPSAGCGGATRRLAWQRE